MANTAVTMELAHSMHWNLPIANWMKSKHSAKLLSNSGHQGNSQRKDQRCSTVEQPQFGRRTLCKQPTVFSKSSVKIPLLLILIILIPATHRIKSERLEADRPICRACQRSRWASWPGRTDCRLKSEPATAPRCAISVTTTGSRAQTSPHSAPQPVNTRP